MRTLAALTTVIVLAVAGCGSVKNAPSDGGHIDARVIDAPKTIDAMPPDGGTIDAAPKVAPPGTQINSAGGHVSGGTYTMDVQLGTPMSQQPVTGGSNSFEGNAPIKP